ncbi:hypothetical protein SUDANB15_02948 [Streptomyces sp. enrichment culture]|uniref:DUF397 domain-containing protein n=1 Tax=Streptomyces sp. enrichment culture TaxID=1795815 RepID=UPI003F56C75B
MQTLRRQKSTCRGDSSDCVETATTPATVHVRGSKDVSGPRLALSHATRVAFIAYADKLGDSELGS